MENENEQANDGTVCPNEDIAYFRGELYLYAPGELSAGGEASDLLRDDDIKQGDTQSDAGRLRELGA